MQSTTRFLKHSTFSTLFILAACSCARSQTDDLLMCPAYRIGIGVGYLQTGGDLKTIWGNGLALDFTLGYRPWPSVQLDLCGIYSSTGISEWMRNDIRVYYSSTGETESRKTSGGNHYELLFGPTWLLQIPGTALTAAIGAGGRYSASQEAGMSNIEDYFPRWTYGWGGYARLGIELLTQTGLGTLIYAVRGHYFLGHIKVNDFYFDRVYGKSSYDEIDPTYLSDRRLHVSLGVTLEFN